MRQLARRVLLGRKFFPAGVTLQPIDGGPSYYGDHGFTHAKNAGWDNPTYFPIGVWYASITGQGDADRWADLNMNVAFRTTGDTSNALLRSNGISAIESYSETPDMGTETVGLLSADEPSTFASGVSTPIGNTPNSVQDSRFWYLNTTWHFIHYEGLSPIASSAEVLYTLCNTPNATQRHIDIQSVDLYCYAGARGTTGFWRGVGGVIYNLGRDMTEDEMARRGIFGDLITKERTFQTGHYPAPIFAFVENGGPYTDNATADTYIQPQELNSAVWSSIIHGARGIIYFNHTFAGPAQTNDNLENSFYQTLQGSQTISIYDQTKATNLLIKQMAPIINSPTAVGYATVVPAATALDGIELIAKYYNGKFYIFSTTRGSGDTTNISATFTIKNTGAVQATVLGENRAVALTGGGTTFTDTFATGEVVHIYRID